MADTAFRKKAAPVKPESEVLPGGKETTRGAEAEVEVPYLDYENEHNHPHSVDYFKLGDTWEDPDGGFYKEVGVIEDYIQSRIKSGEINNNVGAVKAELEKLEKLNNLDSEERTVVKIGVLAAYLQFLMKTDKVKSKYERSMKRKYANQ